jgi:hypothetical protein
MVNGNGLTRWYVLETPIMLMRFTMPRLFNIAHFQNQRKTSPRHGVHGDLLDCVAFWQEQDSALLLR